MCTRTHSTQKKRMDSLWTGAAALVALATGGFLLQQQTSETKRQQEIEAMKKKRMAILKAEQDRKREEDTNTSDPKVICYFGSQTGTAEGFAKAVAGQAKKFGFVGKTMDLDDFDSFEENFVNPERTIHVFILATYGEGEPSDNAIAFSNKLKRQLDIGALEQSFRFTVFGLGNKQYEHFNKFGRWVDSSLKEIGGERVYTYGEGDDDGTLQDDFAAWVEDLHAELAQQQGLEAMVETTQVERPNFTQDFQWISVQDLPDGGRFVESERKKLSVEVKVDFSSKPYFKTEAFQVLAVRELKRGATEENSTLHVELALPASLKQYGTAHNLSIMPENSAEQVAMVAKALGWTDKLDEWFSLRTVKTTPQVDYALFPSPCTLRCALTTCVDLSALPTKLWVEKMAFFAKDPVEQKQLQRLSSRAGKHEFHAMVVAKRLRLFEFLLLFPSLQFDHPGQFLELAPRISPRDYTIASSNKIHPQQVHLIVSMACDPLVEREGMCFGMCTSSLNRRREQDGKNPVYAFLKPSAFLLPAQTRTPILLIGPGTGVAPMRALLQERKWQKDQNMRVGESALFFGCRKRDEDFYYEDEWQALKEEGVLTRLHCAFSREQAHKKVYVQDLLVEEGEWVWEWINELGAHVYVCGSTLMGKDVNAALHGLAKTHGKLTEAQTNEYFKSMSAKNRYVQELWS